jgi:hypothetical protein
LVRLASLLLRPFVARRCLFTSGASLVGGPRPSFSAAARSTLAGLPGCFAAFLGLARGPRYARPLGVELVRQPLHLSFRLRNLAVELLEAPT